MQEFQRQKGFTLIELMIVVAIIGVLSAVAVPAYKSHTAKTEVSAAVLSVKALLVNIDQEIINKGTFPSSLNTIGASEKMNAMGLLALDADTKKITFKWVGNNNSISADETVTYTRSDTEGWSCQLSSGINADYQPKSCKS